MRRREHTTHQDTALGARSSDTAAPTPASRHEGKRTIRRGLGVLAAMAGLVGLVIAAAPAQAAGGVIIYKVQYNSPGTDTGSNLSLNSEYVVLKNTAGTTRTITGWTLRDATGHKYTFPTTRIAAANYLYVRTGRGTNTAHTRYWGNGYYIWNNSGDTAYLRNGSGTLIDSCKWGSTGSVKYC
jgi:Lamin Tail Domain